MKRINSGIIVIGLTLLSCNSYKTVEWVQSTPIAKWQTKELTAKNSSSIPDSAVIIFPDRKQQSIEGFGGCFNELGWEALSLLNRDAQEKIFESLFDTTAGCRFNICRMPVGANDYAVEWYSCDEAPGDFEMNHFSIERDRLRLIPFIKRAQKFKPDLKMWASPWCPPSCIWEPIALAEFIGKYLGPEFAKDGIETEVWLGTIERPQIERIDAILNDPVAKKYIRGVGFQWAGKDAIPMVSKKYPDIKLMQTETECGDGSNDWKAAEHTFGLIRHYFNNGANAYMYWNMVLNESGKSQWGWKQNSMISINSITREVTYNPEYYLMKHFSHFINPGAYKLVSSDETCLAFKNHDSIIIEYYNASGRTMKKFLIGNLTFEAELSAKSLNTFNIKM